MKAEHSILLSVLPAYAQLIAGGHKTVEIRKQFPCGPRIAGMTIWIYASAPLQAVIARARIEEVRLLERDEIWDLYRNEAAISRPDFRRYFGSRAFGYAILLSGAARVEPPLSRKALIAGGHRPAQSWRYADFSRGSRRARDSHAH